MKDKLSFKNPDDLKIKIEKLVSFQEKEDRLEKSQKATEESHDTSRIPSKYAKVLSCSFVKTGTDNASVKRRGAERS